MNPFKPLGTYGAPSRIKEIAYAAEADLVLDLVKDVRRANVSQPTLDAAKALETAARAVKAEIDALEPLEEKHAKALAERDALALDWERTFAALKSSAKTAESEGASGLFERLFKTEAKPDPRPKPPAPPSGSTP